MSDFVAPTTSPVPVARSRARHVTATLRTYFLLTKPRVIELLLVTTLPAMILADDGIPSIGLIAAVLFGGALAAGGANTINCWIERDSDHLMKRTRHRPLPAGDVEPKAALVFGIILETVAFGLLWATANLLAASLAVSAMLFYVFVYPIWLKPRSPQNIVIGGAAGAVPALVGWASVTGSLAAPAWVLFAIVFCWTPPHFWALALKYRDDYAAAGIPMLPVVKGTAVAVRQILIYSVVVLVVSLTLPLVTPMTPLYPIVAAVLGVLFVITAERLRRDPTPERAIKLFTFSNTYLALLFATVAVDTLISAS
ncbi:MAG: heme o synthase [Acidimicrobiia bacterium]|nr:heme o synthase [Acidimicrobiia bacterium]